MLVIDEAHLLQADQLESVRMLTNHAMDSAAMFACLLVGQPTLRRRLKLGQLAALDQRIAVRYHMTGMTTAETTSYLRHHLACSPSLRMSMLATLSVGTPGHEVPRPAVAGRGWWWTRRRRGGQSVAVASSLIAVRAEDSSAMVLPAAHAASSAVTASLLMARGRPRAWPWIARTASSLKRVSDRPACCRWARMYPPASLRLSAGAGVW